MALKNHVTHKYHSAGTDENIRRLLTTHLKYLREHSTTVTHVVDHTEARTHYYNLFSYLTFKELPCKLHWVTLLISDIDSPEDFDEDCHYLKFPDEALIDSILSLHS